MPSQNRGLQQGAVLLCSKAMVSVARKLQQQYGTHWFEGSFYGITDTSQALRDFAKALNDSDLTARIEALILREETRVRNELEPWKVRLKGKRVLLFTGGVKAGRSFQHCRIWGWWSLLPAPRNPRNVREFRETHPEFADIAVVGVNTPDFTGSVETGYAATLTEIIRALVPEAKDAGTYPRKRTTCMDAGGT